MCFEQNRGAVGIDAYCAERAGGEATLGSIWLSCFTALLR
jgi:hypothetical protein